LCKPQAGARREVRRGLLVLAFALVVSACATGQKPRPPAPAPAPVPPPVEQGAKSVSVNGYEQKIIDQTNAFRAENKLPPLKPKVQLLIVAQNHARNMARQDRFGDSDKNGHVLDGKRLEDRIKVSGYPFAEVAENVGYQYNKPDPVAAMMRGWKDSPGHRRNMLIPDISEIGVGAAQGKSGRWYFVQVFGHPQPTRQGILGDRWISASADIAL
jgi:uncharacterized protein YkwD